MIRKLNGGKETVNRLFFLAVNISDAFECLSNNQNAGVLYDCVVESRIYSLTVTFNLKLTGNPDGVWSTGNEQIT